MLMTAWLCLPKCFTHSIHLDVLSVLGQVLDQSAGALRRSPNRHTCSGEELLLTQCVRFFPFNLTYTMRL
jgi:hypothetical protein